MHRFVPWFLIAKECRLQIKLCRSSSRFHRVLRLRNTRRHICAGKGKKFCCCEQTMERKVLSCETWNISCCCWVWFVFCYLYKNGLETPLENFTWDLKHLNHSPYVEFLTSITTFQQIRTTKKENCAFSFLHFLYAEAKTRSSNFFACVNFALITLNITGSINTGFA